ncbi:Protein of unknown function DUF858,methyltransferase-like [Ostreococcus tauri]|uniref:Alpha N-terminal protein methyltransferase 1 n=1 Tax=Ostreococcus tauri TaxID=70448 RepID=A0A090N3V1_OSTTA|nr:Protein of unknown function DUF858,methyltransferase-like [Ostreococcus tauri]CEF98758.1 Protein of unknown function DUF858,methyltransferase-like [Ostreococcus tauri]|eukprot:XP_003080380.2 Protein of unknown function DUF858,methyltransferase-like [Ostreococcus tauri]
MSARAPASTTSGATVFLGVDDLGRPVGAHDEFWRRVARGATRDDGKPLWYARGIEYWDGVDANVEGVLGGFGAVSPLDARDNSVLLRDARGRREADGGGATREKTRALDCGAGVGRVTGTFLIDHFDEVDLVEPCGHFLDAARADPAVTGTGRTDGHRAREFFEEPLETFTPEVGAYDVIWIQWCIGHLTDDDLVAFLRRCRDGLREGGCIVMKENNASSGFILDLEDSSVTRCHEYLLHIIERSGMRCVEHRKQTGFPPELFTVRMYVIEP